MSFWYQAAVRAKGTTFRTLRLALIPQGLDEISYTLLLAIPCAGVVVDLACLYEGAGFSTTAVGH